MNKHLDESFDIIGKIDAVLNSIDAVYLEEAPSGEQNLFYLVEDLLRRLEDELVMLTNDVDVVDAIYASVKMQNICTLKTDRQ